MASRIHIASSLIILACIGTTGCATSRLEVSNPSRTPNARGIVFAVAGAGGSDATSTALRQEIEAAGLPLNVESVDWSHGHGRFLSDQMHWEHARSEGVRLAERVTAYRAECPTGDVYLVGHSAGSAVALAAGDVLPAGSLRRIVLLAPSVSADYDLRPALRSAQDGIDVFLSGRDVLYLGVGAAITGTADRRWLSPAAGRTGFRQKAECSEDAALYQKLHQHGWQPGVEWTGNHGGHYDGYKPAYLRSYVLPLFQ